jgi:hypothetical protein
VRGRLCSVKHFEIAVCLERLPVRKNAWTGIFRLALNRLAPSDQILNHRAFSDKTLLIAVAQANGSAGRKSRGPLPSRLLPYCPRLFRFKSTVDTHFRRMSACHGNALVIFGTLVKKEAIELDEIVDTWSKALWSS